MPEKEASETGTVQDRDFQTISETRGLLYKNRSSPKTDSLLANRSSVSEFVLGEDLFANRESVFGEDLFLYSSPLDSMAAQTLIP